MLKTCKALGLLAAIAWTGCGGSDDGSPVSGAAGQSPDDAGAEASAQDGSGDAADEPSEASAESSADAAAEAAASDCTQPPRAFWIYDLSVMPPAYIQVEATCRAQGDHVYLYVADDIWDAQMTASDVEQVMTAFEKSTPADPAKGIFQLATGTFGATTDVDDDGHVFLLFYEIQGYQGYQFDGFIRREDMLGGTKSNQAEVLYLDGVRNDPGSEYMLGVAAHEFEHMIMLNQNPAQAGWLDETMAETSMIACGYYGDLADWVKPDFAKNPTQTLTTEPPKFNYGAGFLFGGYLFERFGAGFFSVLAKGSSTGIAAIDAALVAQGKTDTFRSLLPDWAMANFLDAPAIDQGQYGYKAFEVPVMASTAAAVPAAEATYSVQPYSARYVLYTVGGPDNSTLQLTMQSDDYATLAFRYAGYPDTDKASAQVGAFSMSGATDSLAVPAVGGSINRVVLAIVETGGAAATVKIAAAQP